MLKENVIARPALKEKIIQEILWGAVFTTLTVATPAVAHHFHLAGQLFLPMHLFVMVAALILGWRVGLAVGLLSPVASFFVSGMPVLNILPLILVELAVYGLVAGALSRNLKMPPWLSLISAMVAGRLMLLPAAIIFGGVASPVTYLSQAVKIGWPGVVLQLLLVPVIVKALSSVWQNKTE